MDGAAFVKFTGKWTMYPTPARSLWRQMEDLRVRRDRTIQTASKKADTGKGTTACARMGLGPVRQTDAVATPPLPGIVGHGPVPLTD